MSKKHIMAILALALCTALGIVTTSVLGQEGKTGRVPEDFSFALTWGVRDDSFYDSATGVLVKDNHAAHREDYVTEYHLTEQERQQVWELIQKLDPRSYPDRYDPQNGRSKPPMTLILTVRTAAWEKTIRAEGIAISYESEDAKGQQFLDTCRSIQELIYATDAWQALPEYETLYL